MRTKDVKKISRAAVAATALAGILAASGCANRPAAHPALSRAESATGCADSAPGPLTLVLGDRADSPAPQLPDEVNSLVNQAISDHQPITLVRVDGEPAEVSRGTFSNRAKNGPAQSAERTTFQDQLGAAIRAVRAVKPEADPLKALDLAGRASGPGGTVVLIDSGLQTVAPLDFRTADLLDAVPSDVTAFLSEQKELPALDGIQVVLDGIGDTADPQPRLSTSEHAHLVGLWRSIALKAGARCVSVLDAPASGPAVSGVPAVSVVAVPQPTSYLPGCGEQVLQDDGSVGFLPNSARLRDPAGARSALSRLAAWVVAGGHRVQLTGTTADWGTASGRKELSTARADQVRRLLVGLRVPNDRISSVGVGSDWPGYIPDRSAQGGLLPGPAEHNRSVVLVVHC